MSATSEAAAALKKEKAEMVGRYAALFVMPILMVGMMITGYLGAMHSPAPNNMPIVVAGAVTEAAPFAESLENADPGAVETRVVEDAGQARRLVIDREVAGAVSLDGDTATLYTAGGAGASQRSVVTSIVTPHALAQGMTVTAEDLAPLPDTDMSGLGAMFMATALALAGYLPFSVVVSNSPELLRFRRAVPLLAAWSAIVAALVWVVTGPLLGVVHGHTAQVLAISWLAVFAIGSVQLFLTRIFGAMAVLVGMLFLMALGIPASNMGMSIYTLPSLYPVLHAFLPTPATGEALRSVLYFDGAGVLPHLVVLALGATAGLGATVLVDRRRERKNPSPDPVVISMPSLHGGPRPRSRFWRYTSLFLFPFLMVGMMISVMLGAMDKPTPREMPVAVVGTTIEQAQQTIDGLNSQMEGLFDLDAVATTEQARERVAAREVVGAFVLPTPGAPAATLLVNEAGGSPAQQIVSQVFAQVASGQQVDLVTEDVAPLPTSDSAGNVSMYIAMGWILAGFLVIVVGANAAPTSRPLRRLLPITAVYAVVMSGFVWLIAGPITGAISEHFWPLLGVGAIAIFCVAMFSAVLERLLGMLAVIPVVGVLMFLGVPSSNGALSIYMEPTIFRILHDYLPMPAAVESIRSILYFDGDVVPGHLLTFAIVGVISLVLVMLIDRIKPLRTTIDHHTEPATPPAPAPAAPGSDASELARV
ncbi:ABC transporter permease [Dietzia alimentaria]|uniref:ABC transporter permease n=1 Tax=Dietzia alimentaria TaxID=665550 RepID=UPI00029AA5BC|nr:ABC transporter permease [Dietzia alimentaria]